MAVIGDRNDSKSAKAHTVEELYDRCIRLLQLLNLNSVARGISRHRTFLMPYKMGQV